MGISFALSVPGATSWDLVNDDIDVVVELPDGRRFVATFMTMAKINNIFAKNRLTGECRGGLYLWGKHIVVVRDLSLGTLHETVEDLVQSGEIEDAFEAMVPRDPGQPA